MTTIARSLAVGTALLGLALGLALPAVANDNCKIYALTTAKQQKENEDRNCGFSGPEWSKDIAAQEQWCATVTPDEWRERVEQRQQKLASECN